MVPSVRTAESQRVKNKAKMIDKGTNWPNPTEIKVLINCISCDSHPNYITITRKVTNISFQEEEQQLFVVAIHKLSFYYFYYYYY